MRGKLYELHLNKEEAIVRIYSSVRGVILTFPMGINHDITFLYYVIKYREEIVAIIISSYAKAIEHDSANQEIYYLFGSLFQLIIR